MILTPVPQSIQERVRTKMANSDLPEEILIDIFSRLPAKSLGKCRCLSKSWRTLLPSPYFIKLHLTRKPDHQNLILTTRSGRVLSIAAIKDGAATTTLDFLGNFRPNVVGSCDGLVLLVTDEREKLLVNPITQQQVIIPDSPLALEKRKSGSMFGFGYDRVSDDYKVVAISYFYSDRYGPDTFVDVYSVKRGVWKRVKNSPYDHYLRNEHSGAFVNGAIHWFAGSRGSDYTFLIVAFSLADEVFVEIPAPFFVDVDEFSNGRPAVVGGCLCAIYISFNHKIDIWMMKEYGRGDSWMRLIGNVNYIWKPLCYLGDGEEEEEVVLLPGGESLVVYNRKEGRLRHMIVDGGEVLIEDGATFVPSLVSPAMLMEL